MKQLLRQKLTTLLLLLVSCGTIWADDFTVERAVNLSQLDSWADISKFQWEEINQFIQDNGAEMDALKEVFRDPAPKDTVGFYKQIFDARDNQYIVLRLDKAQGNRPFYVRVTCIKSTTDPSLNNTKVFSANNYAYIMPPITENQIEVKIWPQGQGEETAKTYTFKSHSYGSASGGYGYSNADYWNLFYSDYQDDPNHMFTYFPINRNEGGMSTMILGYPVELPEGVTAWWATSLSNGNVNLQKLGTQIVPALTPVLLTYEGPDHSISHTMKATIQALQPIMKTISSRAALIQVATI